MNRNTTIILLVILGAFVLYLVLVQAPKDEAAARSTPTPGVTTQFVFPASTGEDIRAARLMEQATGRTVALSRDSEGMWSITEPQPEAADQMAAAEAAQRFASLMVNTTITSTTDMSGFGVLNPSYSVQVDLTDGRRMRVSVGDKTPTGTGYYMLREGETQVIVVTGTSFDSVVELLDQPPVVTSPAPSVTDGTNGTGAETETPVAIPGGAATAVP